MDIIQKRYVVNEENQPVAVQLDLPTFEKLERIIEDHALGQYMLEEDDDEGLELEAARAYYGQLDKAP